MRPSRGTAARLRRFTTRALSRLVLVVALLGCLFGGLVLITTPALTSSGSGVSGHEFDEDVASSWGRYNEGVAEAEPAWTADDFLAVVGDGAPARVVSMPGSGSVLDVPRVEAAIAGTDVLVVVTPPSPLGAIETTRVRDNTVQKYWADEHDIQLVMVHGAYAYVPPGDQYELIVQATSGPGLPTVDSLVYGDATDAVLRAAASVLDREYDEDSEVATTAEELAPAGRAPTDGELDPVVAALQSSGLYVDPEVPNPPEADASWPSLGEDAKVAVFPTAAPGEYVDYVAALHEEFPDSPVVVVTGSWVQTAGLDAQRATDVMLQLQALAGFPLASATPEPHRLLTMFSNIYEVATVAAEVHTGVPTVPPDGIPRWVAYLVLAASLVLVAGFFLGSFLESRAGRREPWTGWRDRVSGALLERYVAVGGALSVSLASSEDNKVARRRLDLAYGAVLEARGTQSPEHAARLIADAWEHLDVAAARLSDPEVGPSAALPAGDRTPPAGSSTRAANTHTSNTHTSNTHTSNTRAASTRRGAKRKSTAAPARGAAWVVGVGVLAVLILFGGRLLSAGLVGTSAEIDDVVSALRTSNAHAEGVDVDIEGVQQAISTRSLMLVYSDSPDGGTADEVAAQYPDAVVFVIRDGRVDGAEIGSDAQAGDYDVYALIDDYYDIQTAAGTDPVAQARQFALLYDRLVAEGSIDGIDRLHFGPPVPWGLVAVGMVIAVVVAAFLVYAAGIRVTRSREERGDVAGRRDALQLRLAESATQLLQAESTDIETLARLGRRERALASDVLVAEPADLDALRVRIDEFDVEVNAALMPGPEGDAPDR